MQYQESVSRALIFIASIVLQTRQSVLLAQPWILTIWTVVRALTVLLPITLVMTFVARVL